MSDFDERSKELATRFEVLRPSLAEADAARVDDALKRHATLRSGSMSLLCEIAEDKGDDKKADTFTSRLDQAAKDVLAVLNGLLDGINEPSANLRAFRDVAASEESTFFDGIKKLNCGATRDEMMRFQHDLEWFTAILRAKWENLSGTEKSLLLKERLIAGRMRETMKKVYEEAVPGYLTMTRDGLDYVATIEKTKTEINADLKVKVKEALEKRGKDTTAAQAIIELVKPGSMAAKGVYAALGVFNPIAAGLLKGMGKTAKTLEPFVQDVIDQQAAEIQSNLSCGRTVIVTFSNTRRQAAEYVRTNGYRVAKQDCENARKELADFVSGQPSSSDALEAEAQRFADFAQSSWLYFLELMRIQNDTFVKDFGGIFVDSVSETTINELTDKPHLHEFADGITNMDLDQKLNEVHAKVVELNGDLDRAFGSLNDFSELPVEAQAMLQEQVKLCEELVHLPFTREMAEELRKLDAARGKKPKAAIDRIRDAVNDMVHEAIREPGAPSK